MYRLYRHSLRIRTPGRERWRMITPCCSININILFIIALYTNSRWRTVSLLVFCGGHSKDGVSYHCYDVGITKHSELSNNIKICNYKINRKVPQDYHVLYFKLDWDSFHIRIPYSGYFFSFTL